MKKGTISLIATSILTLSALAAKVPHLIKMER
jgi:hypothetical protein